jgi:hypothetical protein
MQDENRHGDFFAAVSPPGCSSDWRAKALVPLLLPLRLHHLSDNQALRLLRV